MKTYEEKVNDFYDLLRKSYYAFPILIPSIFTEKSLNFFVFLNDKENKNLPNFPIRKFLELKNEPNFISGNIRFPQESLFFPNDIIVGGFLNLRGSFMTELPENLTVIGDLILTSSSIGSIPKSLKVYGDVMLYDTTIETQYCYHQLKEMFPDAREIWTSARERGL
jgi:hypothetical protein